MKGTILFAALTALMPAALLADDAPQCATSPIVLFDHGDLGSEYWRIPALATTNRGIVVAVADKRNNSNGDLPNIIDLAIRRSSDLGDTWTDPVVILPADEGGGYGDAALGVHRPTGDLVIVCAHGPGLWDATDEHHQRLAVIRSSDDGLTWSAPVDITSQIYDPEPGVAPVTARAGFASSGAMLCDNNGRLEFVLVANSTHQEWGPLYCYLCYSDDGGHTWQVMPPIVDENGDESKVAQLADGSLYMSIRNRTKGAGRKISHSLDNGATWSRPLAEWQLIDPACNGDLIVISPEYLSKIGVTDIIGEEAASNGLMLHSLASDPENRRNVSIFYSLDKGYRWHELTNVTPENSAYSALALLPDGQLGCFYEEDHPQGGFKLKFRKYSLPCLLSAH